MVAERTDKKRWRRWSEIGRTQLAGIDLGSAVAILPIAAVEQHGPHLPFGVDLIINEMLLERAQATWPASMRHCSVAITLTRRNPKSAAACTWSDPDG